MRRLIAAALTLALAAVAPPARAAGPDRDASQKPPKPSRAVKFSVADAACSPEEAWSFSLRFGDVFPDEFAKSLKDGASLGSALLEVARLARSPRYSEHWALGNYWIGRLYFKHRLYSLARDAFEGFLAAQSSTPKGLHEALGIQVAALECLIRVSREAPLLGFPESLRLGRYRPLLKELSPRHAMIVQDAAIWSLKADLDRYASAGDSDPAARELLGLLKAGGPHDLLARGLLAARHQEFDRAIPLLEKFVRAETLPSQYLSAFRDPANLLLGRMQYTERQFAPAAQSFRRVEKDSNLLIQSLSDLGWSYQLQGHHSGALGTGFGFQARQIQNAFAPESSIVMAISFYELCRFPEAYAALQGFRRNYQGAYHWLKDWWTASRASSARAEGRARQPGDRKAAAAAPLSPKSPYALAVEFVRGQGGLPDRVGTELIRSPIFLGAQSEINSLRQARERIPSLRVAGFPFWYRAIDAFARTIDEREKELVADINEDLKARMLEMLRGLDETGINAEILEAETLRKAGDDVIWQNLNPGFREFALEQKGKISRTRGHFWDFGERPSTYLAKGELWQDELGSFMAASSDLCKPRQSYRTADAPAGR